MFFLFLLLLFINSINKKNFDFLFVDNSGNYFFCFKYITKNLIYIYLDTFKTTIRWQYKYLH